MFSDLIFRAIVTQQIKHDDLCIVGTLHNDSD